MDNHSISFSPFKVIFCTFWSILIPITEVSITINKLHIPYLTASGLRLANRMITLKVMAFSSFHCSKLIHLLLSFVYCYHYALVNNWLHSVASTHQLYIVIENYDKIYILFLQYVDSLNSLNCDWNLITLTWLTKW